MRIRRERAEIAGPRSPEPAQKRGDLKNSPNLGGTTKQACSRPKPGDGSIFFAPAAFWRTVERLILHSKFAGAAQHFLLLLQKKTLAKEKEPEGISISPQTPLNRPEKPLRFFWTFPAIAENPMRIRTAQFFICRTFYRKYSKATSCKSDSPVSGGAQQKLVR